MVVLATPDVQLVFTVPPELEEAIEKSKEAEVKVKLPPVVLDKVIATLVAFTVSASATDPDLIMKVADGEERDTDVSKL